MLNKKEILEWIDQASIDNYIPELQDTFGTEWIEKLKDEIVSGRFDALVSPKTCVEFKYAIGDTVWITAMESEAKILSLWYAKTGIRYQCRWAADGKYNEEYLFEDEILARKP